ncbi:helix-turn-helix transcriptional regulator [Kribbella qitaiheensis]|uniref:Helix-turn-helix transcriptional regulator n=1 Tax=Kribbella qitaiheensis TaxID=1544730 RepID=A0A7G6WXA2_9ACTN|nr:helix-turn-helix transcriptional regulator [Kribbella qitaiheensis]QNE18617.1 helix-turn-helix transcriptional regulator [Kribbella qitaiheensis]
MTAAIGEAGERGSEPTSTRVHIAALIREARVASGMSQARLGDRVSVSRYVINRLEGGAQDLTLELAPRLGEVLNLPELEELTRGQFQSSTRVRYATTRDARLRELVSAPGLDKLVIVAADEFDILGLLEKALIDLPPTVTIVFPTHARQQQLRGPADPKATTWAVQNQITRIFEALASGGRLRPDEGPIGSEIKLYESDHVRQSFVVVATAEGGTQCAAWPIMPNVRPESTESIPVTVSSDTSFIQVIDDHVSELQSGKEPLTHLKAVVVVGQDRQKTGDTPTALHRLSSYFHLGVDDERAAARSGQKSRFGFGVSLVLIHGYASQSGRPLARRILLPRDPKSGSYQLFSTHISDEDLEGTGEQGPRSTSTAGAAQRKFITSDKRAIVTPEAFIRAARHGLLDEFGADVPVEAFQPVELPESLWIVEKGQNDDRLMPVLPRLFHLDLSPQAHEEEIARRRRENSAPGSIGGDQEGPPWVGILETNLEAAGSLAFGQQDLRNPTVRLNNFLRTARTQTEDWFFSVLNDLEIEKD